MQTQKASPASLEAAVAARSDDAVVRWRLIVLLRAGYGWDHAGELVRGADGDAGNARRGGSGALLQAAVRRPPRLARRAARPGARLGRARRHRRGRLRRGGAGEARRGCARAALTRGPSRVRLAVMEHRGPLLRLAIAGVSFYRDRVSSRLPR